jgi:para-nitrobenzyl esterase
VKHWCQQLVIICLISFSIIACNSSDKKKGTPLVAQPETQRMTKYGKVIGTDGLYNSHTWKGIPFAKPPVGELRWRSPQKPDAWQSARETLKFGNLCPQLANRTRSDNEVEDGSPIGNEDCLYLNIWAPKFNPQQIPKAKNRLPVMVWLHGGGNVIGHGGNYNGGNLASTHQLLIVSVNYRLGPFGWFSHHALREKTFSPEERSGNFGTLDLIRALEWVKFNISAFGGDPDNVTVFGQSAGGYNIISLLVSPKAEGLFHKAISQSGETPFPTLEEAEGGYSAPTNSDKITSTDAIIRLLITDQKAVDRPAAISYLKSMTADQLVAYLRSKNRDELLNAFRRIDKKGSRVMGMDIHSNFMDGEVIQNGDPAELMKDSNTYNEVPVIFGTTRDELALLMAFDPKYINN